MWWALVVFFVKGVINSPLPLNLLEFTSKNENNTAQLFWKTTNEINVNHFEIQKSEDSKSFFKIGQISASNTNETNNYNYIDFNLNQNQTYYYRLKMVDIDGKYTYSKVISLQNSKNSTSKISPNPSINQLLLSIDEVLLNIEAKIVNTLGQEIKSIILVEKETILKTLDLPIGIYFIKLKDGKTLKFSKE